MAVTLGGTTNLPTRDHVIGNRREIICDITLDSSYPTGGYPLTFKDLGLDLVPDIIQVTSASGNTFGYDYVNSKLKVFSGGSEVSNATDLHTVVGRLRATGKGTGRPVS